MDSIYRCSTKSGKIVEIDADNMDSVGVIKMLASIVHHVEIQEVLNEVVLPKRIHASPMTRLPGDLRAFIEKRSMPKHMVCQFSTYVLKHNIKPSKYGLVLEAMILREKEESDEQEERRLAGIENRELARSSGRRGTWHEDTTSLVQKNSLGSRVRRSEIR